MKKLLYILALWLALGGSASAQQLLKQSTAATIKLGPFVDATDGFTVETGLTISQADIRLSKNGGDIAQTNNAAGATPDEIGIYDVPLNATDTNTLGRLFVAVNESGARPVTREFLVVPANVYDALVGGSDVLQVDITQINGAPAGTATTPIDAKVVDLSVPALAMFATVNTGQSTAATGSVAKLSQGAADPTAIWSHATRTLTGSVTVGSMANAALDQFVNEDTGLTTAVAGSVAKLSQTTATDTAAIATAVWGHTPNRTLTAAPAWPVAYDAEVLEQVTAGLNTYGALKPTVGGNTLDVTSTGAAGIDWANIENKTTAVALTNTTIATAGTNVATIEGTDATDVIDARILAYGALKPTVAGQTLDVTATGAAGIDWANIENKTATVALTNTTLATTAGTNVATIEGTDATDVIDARILAYGALKPTVSGRALDVTATGGAGIDWANVEGQATAVNLANTTIPGSGGNITTIEGTDATTVIDQRIAAYGGLKPTIAGRTLDITATGAAGVDWSNVEGQASVVDLANTSIETAATTGTDWTTAERSQIRHRLGIDGLAAAPAAVPSLATAATATLIKAKTDSLTFSIAGEVNANARFIAGELAAPFDEPIDANVVAWTPSVHAGIDWANIDNPEAAVDLANTTIVSTGGGSGDVTTIEGTDATDVIDARITAYGALKPSIANRTLDITTQGNAGIDWANVDNQGSPVDLSNTTIAATGSAATDWTTTERSQIRHRLGIDGTAAAPTAVSSLALEDTLADVKAKTDELTFTAAGQIDANVLGWDPAVHAGIDWANIDNQSADVNLESTLIEGGGGIDWADLVGDNDNVTGSFGKLFADINTNIGAPISASLAADIAAFRASIETDIDNIEIEAAGLLTDINAEPIAAGNTFTLVATTTSGLIDRTSKSFFVGSSPTIAIDFRNVIPANGRIITVDEIEISAGTAGGITFGALGRYQTQARVPITPVSPGTYGVLARVTDNNGRIHEGRITIVVP